MALSVGSRSGPQNGHDSPDSAVAAEKWPIFRALFAV
jgi:hypothetical protein